MFSFVICIGAVYGSWPMWGGEPAHQALQTMKGAMSTAPNVKWQFTTGDTVKWQFSAVADCDGNGLPEVIVGSMDCHIYCINGITGAQKWSYPTRSKIRSSPAVGDVDGDGAIEVVFGNDGDTVFCLNGATGAREWFNYLGPSEGIIWSGPAIADVDGDGQKEIVFTSMTTCSGCPKCFALNGATGAVEWEFVIIYQSRSSPAVGDVDGDGKMEVVWGANDYKVYCLRGTDGTKKWEYLTSSSPSSWVESSPVIFNVDGGTDIEVIVGSDCDSIFCLRGTDGTKKWSQKLSGDVQSSPAVGDCDGDGAMEVCVGSLNGYVYCLNGATGAIKWSNYLSPMLASVSTPVSLADIDKDGKLEVLAGTKVSGALEDTLFCLNGENGSVLWKKALGPNVQSPIPADIDNDGCIEIIVGCGDSKVYALDDVGGSSNCGVVTAEEGLPEDVLFIPMGPAIHLHLPSSGQVSLKLYDSSGRLTQILWDGEMASGDHVFLPEISSRGVYLAVMKAGGNIRTIKIIR
ncbi:MAG: FG-GAP-like repeat-containing protein [candidate division WOR-3 bacterium]